MKRRSVAFLLAIALCLSMIPVSTFAAGVEAPNPEWNECTAHGYYVGKGSICWDIDANVHRYEIELYMNNEKIHSENHLLQGYGDTCFVFHSVEKMMQSGAYQVKVRAVSRDGQKSDFAVSSIYNYVHPDITFASPRGLQINGNVLSWQADNSSLSEDLQSFGRSFITVYDQKSDLTWDRAVWGYGDSSEKNYYSLLEYFDILDEEIAEGLIETENFKITVQTISRDIGAVGNSQESEALYFTYSGSSDGYNRLIDVKPRNEYAIFVTNSRGQPIEGASVTWQESGKQKRTEKTGSDGVARFLYEDLSAPVITVSHPDYQNYTREAEALGDKGYELIKLNTQAESSYALTAAIYKNGYVPYDVRVMPVRIGRSDHTWLYKPPSFSLTCRTTGLNAQKYELFQGRNLIATSTTGRFTSLSVNSFSVGEDVFVRVTGPDQQTEDTPLLIKVVEVKASVGEAWKVGGDKLTIPVPDPIPFFGGGQLEVDIPDLPLDFYLSDDTVHVGLNLKLAGTEEKDIADFCKEAKETMDLLRQVGGVQYAFGMSKKINSIMKEDLKGSIAVGPKTKLKFIGYGENKFNENGVTSVKLQLCLVLESKQTLQGPTVVVVVPLTYNIGIKCSAKAIAEGEYQLESGTLDMDFLLKLAAEVKAFAGAGIGSVVGVGVYGAAELASEIQLLSAKIKPGLNKLDLTGELGLKAYFAFWEHEKSFAYNTWHLYTRPGLRSFSADENGEHWAAELYNEDAYSIADLSYLSEESAWLGEDGIRLLGLDDADNEFISLQTDTYRNMQPALGDADGTPVLVWVRANTERGTYNYPQLVYSVYQDGAWSDPQPVDVDNTADSMPVLHTASDGTLWLAYQNTAQTFVDDGSYELSDFAAAQSISVACFDSSSKAFSGLQTVSTSNTYSHSPAISVVNDVPTVVWVSNTNSDYFGTNSTNSICYAQFDNSSWTQAETLASGLNAVTDLAVGELSNAVSVAALTDADNNLSTTGDRQLHVYDLGGTEATPTNGALSALTYATLPDETASKLLWSAEEALMQYDGSSTELVLGMSLPQGFTVLSDRIVFNGADEEKSNVFALICNSQNGWNDPVKLTDQASYLQSMAAAECGSDVYIAAVQTDVSITEESVEDACTLSWLKLSAATDVAVEGLSVDHSAVAPDTSVPLTIDLRNAGDRQLNTVSIRVLNAWEEELLSKPLNASLAPGALESVTVSLPLGDELMPESYTVIAEAADDRDESNNESTITLGYSDLVVDAEMLQLGRSRTALVQVRNEGAATSGGVVTVFAGDVPTASIPVPELAAGESTLFSVDVTRALLGGEGSAVLSFSAEADVEEIFTSNSTAQLFAEVDDSSAVTLKSVSDGQAVVVVDNPLAAVVFVAIYSEDGRMLGFGFRAVDAEAGETTVQHNLSVLPAAYTAKAFLLSADGAHTPLGLTDELRVGAG